uniref:ATP synthase subunit a n=2 Tax=unclassified Curculionoidea TaxID=201752 RepID=A0A346RIT7_9CUCU|nr:ATP synthase F0 subunit 6 [Curculionoidea sp. 6 KM-2017]AXS65994.1 ATP synthase F0 subunit 6 [Curculionoidea sp. 5 KM-2017]
MMMNLFSSFEPATLMALSLNWLSTLIIFTIMPSMYWLIPSRYQLFWIKVLLIIHLEFKTLIKSKIYKGSTLMFTSLFMFILLNNFMGLFPYIFTSSSHLIFTLTLSLPLWLTLMLFGWSQNTIHMFAHLVPQNAPNVLLPFLVIIESISNIIRPGTLAIRLTANMIAGHLLVTLMGNSGSSMSIFLLNILIVAQILLLTLESAVAIIQSYVFSILMTLYSSEVN